MIPEVDPVKARFFKREASDSEGHTDDFERVIQEGEGAGSGPEQDAIRVGMNDFDPAFSGPATTRHLDVNAELGVECRAGRLVGRIYRTDQTDKRQPSRVSLIGANVVTNNQVPDGGGDAGHFDREVFVIVVAGNNKTPRRVRSLGAASEF